MGGALSAIIPDPGAKPLVLPGMVVVKEDRQLLIAESSWRILRSQDSDPYRRTAMSLMQALDTSLATLDASGDNNRPSSHSGGIAALFKDRAASIRKRIERALFNIDLLLSGLEDLCPAPRRAGRSPFSFMGTVLHTLFGTMDEDGERLVNELDTRTSKLVHLLDSQATVVTGVLESFRDVETRVTYLGGQLETLSKKVKKAVDTLTAQITVGEFLSNVADHTSEWVDEVNTFDRVVGQALGGSVPRDLVPDAVLDDVVAQFANSTIDARWLPSLMEVKNLYRCRDVIVFSILLPVPTDETYTLYRLFSPSIALEGKYLTFSLPHSLAVPGGVQDSVIHFAPGGKDDCKMTRTHFLCYGLDVHFQDARFSCPVALLDQNSISLRTIPVLCQFTVAKSYREFFHFLPRSDQLIFSTHTNTSSVLTCGRQSTHHEIRGTGTLSIPASCTLRVGGVLLRSPRAATFPGDVLRVDVPPISTLLPTLLGLIHGNASDTHYVNLQSLKLLNATAQLDLRQKAVVRDLEEVRGLGDRVGSHGVRDLSWLSSLTVLFFLGTVGGLIAGYRRFKVYQPNSPLPDSGDGDQAVYHELHPPAVPLVGRRVPCPAEAFAMADRSE